MVDREQPHLRQHGLGRIRRSRGRGRRVPGLLTGHRAERLNELVPDDTDRPCLFVADAVTFARPTAAARECVLLVVDVDDEGPDGSFRAAASALAEIEANLSPANTDFGDYVEGVNPDGVYRGLVGM
ncbi:DUF6924 domain-containing protein [Streptomyces sp. NPDC017991]|uniref:DUF6924 domain-containing protein n=1 Tax=Streptomyces sp. NPDC017991 TaxID=3365026 RepID=UPI0037B6D955